MHEIWLPVESCVNYSVSNFGQIRREASGTRKQRILKQYVDRDGYMYVCPSVDGKAKTLRVHRLVCAAFIGAAQGLTVNHKDLNKINNCIENLEYLSGLENTRHAIKHGHISTSNAKITYEQAMDIKAAKNNGEKSINLASLYNISKRTINAIVSGRIWKIKPMK